MRTTVGILSIILGMAAVATPAAAGNEQPRLSLPDTAPAGQTLNDIQGSCGGAEEAVLVSGAIAGGSKKLGTVARFRTDIHVTDQPGTYVVRLVCAGEYRAGDTVTVI